jgi:hypothetical protein
VYLYCYAHAVSFKRKWFMVAFATHKRKIEWLSKVDPEIRTVC